MYRYETASQPHSIIISFPQFGYKHRCSGLTHSYRGVFAELTQRGEGLFVGFPDSVNHLLCVWAQCVALCAFLLFIFFLLLIPVIPYRCTDRKTTKISADGFLPSENPPSCYKMNKSSN